MKNSTKKQAARLIEHEIQVIGYIPRSPNAGARKHWGRKMEERIFWEAAFARSCWVTEVTKATGPRWMEIELWKPGKIKLRDEDNKYASIKHCLDAMVNLGLIVDDNKEQLDLRGVYESNGHKYYATIVRFGDT